MHPEGRKASTREVDHVIVQMIPGGGMAAAYLTVTRGTPNLDRLRAVAQHSMLHETVTERGVVKMVHRDEEFAVDARGTLSLPPGAKHIMLTGLSPSLNETQTTELIVTVERAGTVKVRTKIRPFGD